jgi:electron transfer flavoprotein-quinone oxidoreductase
VPKKFDVIVVGAGPAGSTAALVLAQSGLSVALFERGEYEGAKNMFGGVFYHHGILDSLLPNFLKEAPLERYVTRHTVTLLTPDASLSLDFRDANFAQPPYNGFTLLRAKFDRWYAQKAVAAGAFLIPETVVDDLLWDNNRVAGVKARRDEGEVYSDVVIAADGVNSLLAKKAGLRKDFSAGQLSVAVKELLALPSETIEERFNLKRNEGVASLFIGSFTEGVPGGGFLYTNKASISLGLVASLKIIQEKKISVAELLESFKKHPYVKELIKDAVLKEYSGHMLPEAGLSMVPKLYGDGILLAGDAAALLSSTGMTLEGMNFAIASGLAAAETVKKAKSRGDYSRKSLAYYKTLLEESFVLQDLKRFQRAPHFFAIPRLYKLYPEIACGLAARIFKVDGQPRKKFLSLGREVIKGKVSLWQLVKDVIKAGRALL